MCKPQGVEPNSRLRAADEVDDSMVAGPSTSQEHIAVVLPCSEVSEFHFIEDSPSAKSSLNDQNALLSS